MILSGRYDFIFPEQRAQLPFFPTCSAPLVTASAASAYDTGANVPQAEMIKETLDWLNRHLGPVVR